MLDITLPLLQKSDFPLFKVKAPDTETSPDELKHKGEADIAQSYDTDRHGPVIKALQ